MVFKRRDRRSILKVVAESIYPRRGWGRSFNYIKFRLRRLPDPPHKIARGVFAGVLTSFTPFFTLHFVVASVIAMMMRGNVVAAIFATFFGNPITFPFIAVGSLKFGSWLLGRTYSETESDGIFRKFMSAGADFKDNFFALFTEQHANWSHLEKFYQDVFLPYLIGGILPGLFCATVMYYLTVPLITVYQNRRKGRLKKKLAEIRKKHTKTADDTADDQ